MMNDNSLPAGITPHVTLFSEARAYSSSTTRLLGLLGYYYSCPSARYAEELYEKRSGNTVARMLSILSISPRKSAYLHPIMPCIPYVDHTADLREETFKHSTVFLLAFLIFLCVPRDSPGDSPIYRMSPAVQTMWEWGRLSLSITLFAYCSDLAPLCRRYSSRRTRLSTFYWHRQGAGRGRTVHMRIMVPALLPSCSGRICIMIHRYICPVACSKYTRIWADKVCRARNHNHHHHHHHHHRGTEDGAFATSPLTIVHGKGPG